MTNLTEMYQGIIRLRGQRVTKEHPGIETDASSVTYGPMFLQGANEFHSTFSMHMFSQLSQDWFWG